MILPVVIPFGNCSDASLLAAAAALSLALAELRLPRGTEWLRLMRRTVWIVWRPKRLLLMILIRLTMAFLLLLLISLLLRCTFRL